MTWNPQHYLQFEGERMRPALDLVARVTLAAPREIVDLGCGTGNVTGLLAHRWPEARIVGVDSSVEMLDRARATNPDPARVSFVLADLATFRPACEVDLIYSNAAMQWLDDHAALFPHVASLVRAGGTLAVQMPDNHRAPSHTASIDLARSPQWQARLAALVRATPVAAAAAYFDWLAPHARAIDIWTTEYLQVLPPARGNEHPVAAWTKSTWLLPLLAALDADEQARFMAQYSERLLVAYPPSAGGSVLFPFRRLFIVANR